VHEEHPPGSHSFTTYKYSSVDKKQKGTPTSRHLEEISDYQSGSEEKERQIKRRLQEGKETGAELVRTKDFKRIACYQKKGKGKRN